MSGDALTLYGIEESLAVVAAEIRDTLDAGDEPSEELLLRLAGWTAMERSKADAAAAFLLHLQADAERCEEMARRQKERAAKLMRVRKRLNEHVVAVLTAAGKDRVRGIHHTLRVVNNPGRLEVEDEAELPTEFLETVTTTSVNRAAVKAALERGEEVPGARIEKGKSLRVET